MKRSTKSFLSIMLILGFIGFSVSTAKASGSGDNSQHIDESFTAVIDEIKIDIISYPIFIETHDRDEIIVEADIEDSKYENPLIVELSGDTLEISQIQTAQNITINISEPSRWRGTPSVRGSIVGKQSGFSVTSHTESGSNNLFNQAGSGNKTLNVSTDSGDIDISFTE